MNETRHFECEIVKLMIEDNWDRIPERGQHVQECLEMVIDYVNWLRAKSQDSRNVLI